MLERTTVNDRVCARKKLERLLEEGGESGKAEEMTRQDWEEIRAEALRVLRTRQSVGGLSDNTR